MSRRTGVIFFGLFCWGIGLYTARFVMFLGVVPSEVGTLDGIAAGMTLGPALLYGHSLIKGWDQ